MSTSPYTLQLDDQADEAVRQAIGLPLRVYNEAQAGPSGQRPLVVTLGDAHGLQGGLWGATAYGWLHVELLVVPAAARGQGLGRGCCNGPRRRHGHGAA